MPCPNTLLPHAAKHKAQAKCVGKTHGQRTQTCHWLRGCALVATGLCRRRKQEGKRGKKPCKSRAERREKAESRSPPDAALALAACSKSFHVCASAANDRDHHAHRSQNWPSLPVLARGATRSMLICCLAKRVALKRQHLPCCKCSLGSVPFLFPCFVLCALQLLLLQSNAHGVETLNRLLPLVAMPCSCALLVWLTRAAPAPCGQCLPQCLPRWLWQSSCA